LRSFKLYAITNISKYDPADITKIEQAYRGGADIVQLRSKVLTDQEILRLADKIRAVANQYQKLFFINDRLDLAMAVKADGVHLGQDDLPVEMAQQITRKAHRVLFIGKSTHSLEQAKQAMSEKVDYIGVGPIFATPTKPGRPSVGLELVKQVSEVIRIPFVAIGGIDIHNVHEVIEAGARRIAVVRAVFDQPDIQKATVQLRQHIEGELIHAHT